MTDLYYIDNGTKELGPFSIKEFVELCRKGKITGKEQYRSDLDFNWKKLTAFPELIAALKESIPKTKTIDTDSNPKIIPQETMITSDLTVTLTQKMTANQFTEEHTKIQDNRHFSQLREETKFIERDIPWDTITEEDIIPTPVETPKPLEKEETPEPPVDPFSGEGVTQIFSTQTESDDAFKLIVRQAEEELMPETIEPLEITSETNVTTSSSVAKKITPIGLLAIIGILFYLFYPEKKPVNNDPFRMQITFPVIYEYEDPVRATEYYNQAMQYYALNNYTGKVMAANLLKVAFGFMSKDQDILGRLILTYAELYEAALDPIEARSTITNLLELARFHSINDLNVVLGSSLFYSKINKFLTANTIIENYLRVVKRPSIKLLSQYLNVLMELDERVKAREVFTTLQKIPETQLDIDAFLAMISFLEADELLDDATLLTVRAIGLFPQSVALKLRYLDFLFKREVFNGQDLILADIKGLFAERNPIFFASYLEHSGLLEILKQNYEGGALLLETSLKIHDSNELRSKLAALRIGGSNVTQKLIRESKIRQEIRTAQKLMRENNWKEAMLVAVNAVDMDDQYYASRFALAQIQSKRGYFDLAIKNNKFLLNNKFINDQVYYQLIMTYIDAYMLEDAKVEILKMSSTDFARSADYAHMLGHYYYRLNNEDLALKWLREATRRDTTLDQTHYLIASIYLKNRYYVEARESINKAISLDPENIEYLSFYGRILLEADGSDVGIGHFLNLLTRFPENATILGDIAIAYYKDNEISNFEHYRKRFENAKNPNSSFYEFLIEIASNGENVNDVIYYAEELLKIDPGNLKIKLILAENYYQKEDYKNATLHLNEILQSVAKYPKANYLLAEISYKNKDYDKALEYGDKEVKNNPESELGYYIIGKTLYAKTSYIEAVNKLSQAIARNPNSIEVLYLLSEIKFRQNYLDEALRLCLRAVDSEGKLIYDRTKSADLRKLLGQIYKAMGQSALAAEAFSRYLDIYPNAPDRDFINNQLSVLEY